MPSQSILADSSLGVVVDWELLWDLYRAPVRRQLHSVLLPCEEAGRSLDSRPTCERFANSDDVGGYEGRVFEINVRCLLLRTQYRAAERRIGHVAGPAAR